MVDQLFGDEVNLNMISPGMAMADSCETSSNLEQKSTEKMDGKKYE